MIVMNTPIRKNRTTERKMKVSAEEINRLHYSIPENIMKSQARSWLAKCKEKEKHVIGKMHILVFSKASMVINSESLSVKVFDEEQEAVNFCLDYFEASKRYEQGSLFEE